MVEEHQKYYALASLSDKTGWVELAQQLTQLNIAILASGGTAAVLKKQGIPVTDVANVTQAPEMLGGRVKTLHPAIHGGILARRHHAADVQDMIERGYKFIDLVLCNLYPFVATASKEGVTMAQAVEEMDIGGVTLLRAAAKNHERVTVVSDPQDYARLLEDIKATLASHAASSDPKAMPPLTSTAARKAWALKAFEHTAEYDDAISSYLRTQYMGQGDHQLALRYGMNPHQGPAEIFNPHGPLPFKVLSGSPGYINLLDALNSWGLVLELKQAFNLPAAASFKHVSPAGCAIGLPLTDLEAKIYFVDDMLPEDRASPVFCAYARARGADRMSSFGDWIALSDACDVATARLISKEVSDGIIAPDFSPEALDILRKKKGGKYTVLKMDASFVPPVMERRQVFGLTLSQRRNDLPITREMMMNVVTSRTKSLAESTARDLLLATITLKYTQSNSVCYATNGQVVGLGAGQQSRIHCTRLAGDKADTWWFRHHPRVLALPFKAGVKRAVKSNAIDLYIQGMEMSKDTLDAFVTPPSPLTVEERREWLKQTRGVVVASDGFFPFPDNVQRMAQSGVCHAAAPSGSVMDSVVVETADQLGVGISFLSNRLFHH